MTDNMREHLRWWPDCPTCWGRFFIEFCRVFSGGPKVLSIPDGLPKSLEDLV